ncbi:MAG: T6SS immunity protein Tli4 family protein [Telluria sp.]
MNWDNNKKLVALVVLALVLLSSVRGAVLSFLDRTKVATMTQKMKTVCVGRFLIDMPQEAAVSLARARVAGFDVDSTAESQEDFDRRVAAREAELRAQANDSGKPSLEAVRNYQRNGYSGKIFVYGRWRTSWIEHDHRVYAEGVAVEGFLHGGGTSFSFSNSSVDAGLSGKLARLLDQVSGRDNAEIPGAPGFCIDRGFIREPLSADQRESVAMFASLPNHPDVAIAFSSMVGAAPGPGLLKRTAQAMTNYPFLRPAVKTLRGGTRTINGLPGEEVAVKVTELNFTTSFNFDWETRGKQMDVLAPLLALELQTGVPRPGGKPLQSSFSEVALTELWERVLPSIRLRPVASAKAPPPQAPAVKLGTVAMAGTVCTASGWWQCSEGGDGVGVLGGQRQFMRKGQRMPQALLLPQPKLWEKMRGLQPSYEAVAPTAWKLVDQRAAPRNPGPVPLAQARPAAETELATSAGAAPIGTCVKTGDPCPASGWWRCDDAQALDGTRWFAHGSLLPAATYNMPAGWFGKSAGGPSIIQRRSSWQLVRHAPAPGSHGAEPPQHLVPEGSPA